VGSSTPEQQMTVTVVNIVHTSYCATHAAAAGGAADEQLPAIEDEELEDGSGGGGGQGMGKGRAIVSQLFLWRRLLHLGPQRNHVHPSLKLCYMPPLNASHILFQTGRILETGANNADMARVMLYHCTLPYLRAAGLQQQVRIVRRRKQNIVAKSALPAQRTLDLAALHRDNEDLVKYVPAQFSGAILRLKRWGLLPPAERKRLGKVVMLAFLAGAIVSVGSNSYTKLCDGFLVVLAQLLAHTAEQQQQPQQPQQQRGTKRTRDGGGGGRKRERQRKRPRLDGV